MIKKHNPTTPVLIREAFGIPPQIFARFGKLKLFDCSIVKTVSRLTR